MAQTWLSGGWSQIEPEDTAVQILYPGLRQRTIGPDFIDAIAIIDGRRLTGSIEIHVNASDWRNHRHHLDPAYNNTILHVFMNYDSSLPVITSGGKMVPQARLSPTMTKNCTQLKPIPAFCRHGNDVIRTVKEASMARFEMKSGCFISDLRLQPPNEVLYRGISIALGYQENRTPMRVMAEALTLIDIENRRLDRRPSLLEALILQNAGLLDELSAETDYEARRLWQLLPGRTNPPVLQRNQWRFARVRPVNSPARRLAALKHLIHRHSARQLDTKLLEPLRQKHPVTTMIRLLEESLVVAPRGYWANHSDFGRLLSRPYSLLGAEHASTIAANVILPFANAIGQTSGNKHLSNTAIEVYYAYPVHNDNEVTRYMSQILSLSVKTVCIEQGFIHIYRNWCREKRCQGCPASITKAELQKS